MPQASVTNNYGLVTVSAADPRPLAQAATALTHTYGWTIDYEDPVYPESLSRDIAAASWLLLHPHEQGVLIPSGGNFTANLGQVVPNATGESNALAILVEQYNRSLNPGIFKVLVSSKGRTVISGQSGGKGLPSSSIMDVSFQPSVKNQTAADALQDLATKCGSRKGIPILLGSIPTNALSQSLVDGSNSSFSCREELGRILSAIPYSVAYSLLYDIGMRAYVLNVGPVDRLGKDANGNDILIPVKK